MAQNPLLWPRLFTVSAVLQFRAPMEWIALGVTYAALNGLGGKALSYLCRALAPENFANNLLVLVGAVGIVVAIKSLGRIDAQIVEMRRQLGAMQEQITEMSKQTTVLEKSVEIGQKSADAALLNAKAVINSERPWMMIEVSRPDNTPEFGTLTFTAQNRGRTPAEVTYYSCAFFNHEIEKPFKAEPEFETLEFLHRQYVAASGHRDGLHFRLACQHSRRALEMAERQQ